MKFENIRYVYFLGVGGIGMSALARWFVHNGFTVYGYDKTPSALTHTLEKEGVQIHYQDELQYIPEEVKNHPQHTLVIITPAIPAEHLGWAWLRENAYQIKKRSEVLGMITEGMFTVAVAGTHGKTTTTSMIAHLLKNSGRDCAAFMGGIATNYNTNMLLNESEMHQAIAIVEADEYDKSFMQLHPNIAIVTSTDADHLDIYGEHSAMKDTFRAFVNLLGTEGQLFACQRIAGELKNDSFQAKMITYGLESGQHSVENLKIVEGAFIFDAKIGEKTIKNLILHTPGYHNVENALAAISVAWQLGLTEEEITDAIANYKGVKRRFEYHIKSPEMVYIDDYAHHPGEIDSLLKSVKDMYPNRKITAIFQPHLFSRTRDFADAFSASLSAADAVWLMPIYPAREKPMQGVNSQMLLENITAKEKQVFTAEEIMSEIEKSKLEVLLTIGAGDIDRIVEPLATHLKNQYHVEE